MKYLFALILAAGLLFGGCGPSSGEPTINPKDVIAFKGATIEAYVVGTDEIYVKATLEIALFGMPIQVAISDVVLKENEEDRGYYNCLLAEVELAGGIFAWLADGEDARCYAALEVPPTE